MKNITKYAGRLVVALIGLTLMAIPFITHAQSFTVGTAGAAVWQGVQYQQIYGQPAEVAQIPVHQDVVIYYVEGVCYANRVNTYVQYNGVSSHDVATKVQHCVPLEGK